MATFCGHSDFQQYLNCNPLFVCFCVLILCSIGCIILHVRSILAAIGVMNDNSRSWYILGPAVKRSQMPIEDSLTDGTIESSVRRPHTLVTLMSAYCCAVWRNAINK